MPAEGNDAASLVVGYQLVVDTGEGHAVKVLGIRQFYTAEVEAHYGGIVANSSQYVTPSQFPLPSDTIERIVLMSHHIAPLLQLLHAFGQLFTTSLFGNLWCIARHHHRGSQTK